MAWTTKSNRFTASLGDSHPQIGPGSYRGHGKIDVEPSYAPFGSYKERAEEKPRKTEEMYPSPPPGAYDPKLPGKTESGLPRKHVPFHSSADRGNLNATKNITPGAGAYHKEPPLMLEASRTMGLPQAQQLMFRSASAPSIPRGRQCFGYEEAGAGRLVRQPPKNASLLHTGTGADTAGPGEYEHGKPSMARRATGGTFGTGPARVGPSGIETPGPGHYLDKKQGRGRMPMSSFSSASVRMPDKADSAPGPGSYAQTWQSGKSARELNPELQFFGSTDQRFKGKNSEAVPGPGQYEPAGRKQARTRAKSNMALSNRFDSANGMPDSAQPGPGAYEVEAQPGTSGPLGSASILGSTGSLAFGSMQSRSFGGFSEVKKVTPGPGNYETLSTVPEGAGVPGRLRTGRAGPQNAVFASESAKNSIIHHAERESKKVPAVGQYTPALAKDVSAVMRLPPKQEGFLSGAKRTDSFSGAPPVPGPGNYNPAGVLTAGKMLGTYNRSVIEGARGGFGFNQTGKRFSNNSGGLPGPGAYDTEHNWVTKSHNVHFGDVL